MSTKKELVNKVLVKLRETELSATTAIADSTYALMVASFLNDIKDEVDVAWNWGQYRTTIEVPTVSGTSLYGITGMRYTGKVQSIYNTTKDHQMTKVDEQFMERHTLIGSQQNESPIYYRFRGVDSLGAKQIQVYPVPNAVYTLSCQVINPQAELATDDTELELGIAESAIIYGTWAMCISERGEDGGQLFDEVTAKYHQYLASAIGIDRESYPEEGDVEVV